MLSPDRAEKPEKEKNATAGEKVEKKEPISSNSDDAPKASTALPAEEDEEGDELEAVCRRRPHTLVRTDNRTG